MKNEEVEFVMELYVARHGESVYNLEGRLTGKEANSPLTHKGKLQAIELGKSIASLEFDAIYCSPLIRATETAKLALNDCCELIIDERLAEISLGDMNGLTFEEAQQKYPESGMLFLTDPLSYKTPPNAESIENMISRIGSFLDDLAKQSYKRVFVQAHGYVLRVMYSCCFDKSVESVSKAPIYPNCALVHFTYNNGKWQVNGD